MPRLGFWARRLWMVASARPSQRRQGGNLPIKVSPLLSGHTLPATDRTRQGTRRVAPPYTFCQSQQTLISLTYWGVIDRIKVVWLFLALPTTV